MIVSSTVSLMIFSFYKVILCFNGVSKNELLYTFCLIILGERRTFNDFRDDHLYPPPHTKPSHIKMMQTFRRNKKDVEFICKTFSFFGRQNYFLTLSRVVVM